ncbi:MAG: YaaA family protein [Cellulosilyticaceae bacterium]
MIMILSPAKTFKKIEEGLSFELEKLYFNEQTKQLLGTLGEYTTSEIENLMKVSPAIAETNFARYQDFPGNSEPAYYALDYLEGEAYKNLDANTLSEAARTYAQSHLFILSGLYGVLSPMDIMKPYRLEMGTKLTVEGHQNLYTFWKLMLTRYVKEQLAATDGEQILINLASEEYSKVLDLKEIDKNYSVIQIAFKTEKDGKQKVISMHSKKARGLMTRYILEKQIDTLEGIKQFVGDGYVWSELMSTSKELVFVKK